MNIKNLHLNMLIFGYAFFSFALYTPEERMDAKGWSALLILSALVYIFFSFILFSVQKQKPLANMFLLIYILLLFAKHINQMLEYMKLFHGRSAGVSTFVISVLAIFAFTNTDIKSTKLAVPIIAMIIFLIVILILLNGNKANSGNLFQSYSRGKKVSEYETMFDYIIPYALLSVRYNKRTKKSVISLNMSIAFCFILITVFAFSCLKGDLLYSLSPLQMLFQISSTKVIKNYDAIFNYLLYFAFFSVLIVLAESYKTIKKDFTYFNNADLLLIVLFLVLINCINDINWFCLEIIAVLLFYFGKQKVFF